MEPCEYTSICPFYAGTLSGRDDAEELKRNYCLANALRCARFIIYQALGPERVPADLYPDEKAKAYEVIAQG